MNFTSFFLQFTKDYESPTSFWKWSSYALIAALLRDNVYFEQGLWKCYPNIYVLLLADSAEYRKGVPPLTVSKLLSHEEICNTKIIEGRSSVQAVIDDLSQDIGGKNGFPIRNGSAILIARELASFFVNDPQLIPLITDIYDYQEKFTYGLKSGRFTVKKLCVSMLAASNETFLREVYNQSAIYGGLLGRTFMIKPDETRSPNSLVYIDEKKYDSKDLIELLKRIKKLTGRSTMTTKAAFIFDSWYKELYNSYKKYPDRTGVTQRMHTGALKLATILAAGDYTLVINDEHITEAIIEVTSLRGNYEMYAIGSGKSSQAAIGALFLNSIWESKEKRLTRREIMLRHWRDMLPDDLDKLIISLETAGLIRTTSEGSEVTYEMTEKCKEIFGKAQN